MAAVNARVDDDKLTVWKGCPGKRLVTDAEGAVVGVIVEKDGEELAVKANGGVCLCTGGFEASRDMMASYTQIPYCYLQAGTISTGDGIKMAMKAGELTWWHMSNVSAFNWAYQSPYLSTCSSASGLAGKGIYAGISGKRFMDEFGGYPPRPHRHRRPLDLDPHAPAHLRHRRLRPDRREAPALL